MTTENDCPLRQNNVETSMSKLDFEDARIKLRRARVHISEVDAAIKSFLSTDFYSLRLDMIRKIKLNSFLILCISQTSISML